MTKTKHQPTARSAGLLVSQEGTTSVSERHVRNQTIRTIRIRDESGALIREHIICETTGRHRALTAADLRALDASLTDSILSRSL